MKKAISISLIIFTLILCFVSCKSDEILTINQSKSKIVDYTVENGKVEYLVNIAIKNNSSDKVKFYINADFTDDKNLEFIEESIIYSTSEGEKIEYAILGNEEKIIQAQFYATSTEMEERPINTMPKNITFEILNK